MSKILIVDDEPKNLYMLQVLLSASGFEIVQAANGVEALEQARRAQPDMVISDILMPVMDGFALCRAWKEDERLKDIPFVFYTATYTDPRDEAFALSLGADRFIIKPAEPDKFLALIQSTIKNHAAGKLVASSEPIDETKFLEQYNSSLIRKLEDKVLQLEKANRALELDIIQRKQAEQALSESEERFRSLFENSTIGLYRTTPSGAILLANPTLVRMLGYGTFDELAQRNLEQQGYSPEYSRSQFRERIEQEGELKGIEVSWTRKDGSQIYVRESAKAIRDEHGKVLYYEGTVEDITERKQAEAALLHERDLLHTLMDNIPDTIYFTDTASRFTRVNRAQAQLAGLDDPEQLIGKTDSDVFAKEFASQAFAEEQTIIHSGQSSIDQIQMIPDFKGKPRWFSATRVPIFDQQRKVVGLIGVSRDITERMLAEQQIQTDLKEKTVLLQEVHHRVKNNLAIISALLEMQAAASQDDQVRAAFKISQGRILAMAAVHEQLYRSQKLSQIDMLNYVEALTEGLLASDILSEAKISVAVLDVALDIDHAIPCGLIINELATNAMKYAFKNIQNADRQEKKISIGLHQEKDTYVLKVSDNGAGLPGGLDVKHTRTLGLKLVNRLTGQLDGRLEVESSQLGAKFTITFPVPT